MVSRHAWNATSHSCFGFCPRQQQGAVARAQRLWRGARRQLWCSIRALKRRVGSHSSPLRRSQRTVFPWHAPRARRASRSHGLSPQVRPGRVRNAAAVRGLLSLKAQIRTRAGHRFNSSPPIQRAAASLQETQPSRPLYLIYSSPSSSKGAGAKCVLPHTSILN